MHIADTNTRNAFITGLRQLADYLDTHPDVPVPPYGRSIIVGTDSTEDGGREQVQAIAAALGGTPVIDATTDGGNYTTGRRFGQITYTACAVPRAAMACYYALSSYHGCVEPDTETADA